MSAVMVMAYVLLPYSSFNELVLYTGSVVTTAVAAGVGAARHPVGARRPWVLLAMALGSWAVAETIWWIYSAQGIDPYPSIADVFFLGAYVPLAMAADALARSEGERDRFAWMDALTIAAVAIIPLWSIFMQPLIDDSSLTWIERAVSLSYPLADVAVLAMAARLVFSRAGRTRSGWILVAGLLVMFAADNWFASMELGDGYSPGGIVDILYILGYVVLASAATASRGRAERSAAQAGAVSRRSREHFGDEPVRLLIVLACMLLPELVLLYLAKSNDGRLGTVLTVAAAATLGTTILGSLRQWTFVGRVRRMESRRGASRLAAIVEHSADAVLLVDPSGRILYASPAAADLWPMGHGQSTITDPLDGENAAGLTQQLQNVIALPNQAALITIGIPHADGTDRQLDGTLHNLIADESVRAIVATFHDVTDQRRLQEQLAHQAFHDEVTGLANRALFADRVAHALDRCARRPEVGMAVLFIDLDEFKAVNDGLGHAAGDELLRHVGERLRECIRPADTIARLGGDEFGVLLEDIFTVNEAVHIANRALEVLAMPVDVSGNSLSIPASIGIAPRAENSTVGGLLRDADLAMYRSKSQGKGRVSVFEPSLRTDAESRIAMRVDMPDALARRELEMHYQPIYRLGDRRLIAFEALGRWNHPSKGWIPPKDFVAVAEASGLIVELGEWAMRQACTDGARWISTPGGPDAVHVNVARTQLLHGDFVQLVSTILKDSGLKGQNLVLEVEESCLHDEQRAAEVLHRLRAIGVGIAIDDFGTGYTSLAHLRQFPVTAVKIDPTFMSAVDRGDESLVRSVLAVAQALSLQTIAEGVSSPAQVEALTRLGCQTAQGYLLGRPEPATAIDARTLHPALTNA